MKTAPAMPPPRPPRNGKVVMDSSDGRIPNAGGAARRLLYVRMCAKFLVLALLGIAVAKFGFLTFS